MPSVANRGARIAYEVRGQGPGLVLLHGTGGSGGTTWGPVLPALDSVRTLVVPDLRGSGRTEDSGEPLSLEVLVSDVLAVADHAGLERFDVAGFSLGGFIALALAVSAPHRLASLTVIAAGASGRDSRTRLQFELWRDLYQQDPKLFARFWLLVGLSPAFVAAIPEAELSRAGTFRLAPGLGRQSTLNAEVDLREAINQIEAPALVIGCKHDAVFPPSLSRELASSLRSGRYLELDSGHMAVVEAPAALARALSEFLAETTPTPVRCS